jgi:hypothetical protein
MERKGKKVGKLKGVKHEQQSIAITKVREIEANKQE